LYRGIPPIGETRSYINRVISRLQREPILMREFFPATRSETPLLPVGKKQR
jgi:hypothetical protein